MKLRTDFVTNSSSSSFIVINTEDYDNNVKLSDYVLERFDKAGIFEYGKYQFGWETERSDDFESKFNFLLILLATMAKAVAHMEYGKDGSKTLAKYRENLMLAVADTGMEHINWKKVLERTNATDDYAYIDHQSNVMEHDYSRLFENVNLIRDFLFNDKSCVMTSNDNTGYDYEDEKPFEYCEGYYRDKENCFTI